jgi:hypothetical protein
MASPRTPSSGALCRPWTRSNGTPRGAAKALAGGFLACTLLGGMATAVRAASPVCVLQESSLAGLEAALQGRLDATRPPLRASANERRQLQIAIDALQGYTGLLSSYNSLAQEDWGAATQDMETLVGVAAAVQASQTSDQDVLFQIVAVRDTLDGFGLEIRQVALTTSDLLRSSVSQGEVRARVDDADRDREAALGAWSEAFQAGASRLAAVAPLQRDAALLAEDRLGQEAAAYPTDIVPMSVRVDPTVQDLAGSNSSSVTATVNVNGEYTPELTVTAHAFQGETPEQPSFTLGVQTFTDWRGPLEARFPVEVPLFRNEQVATIQGPRGYAFGSACDIDGDTAVVGVTVPDSNNEYVTGFVQVLERNLGGPNAWGQGQRIEDPIPGAYTIFGAAVAISGDVLVVGAPFRTAALPAPGKAYVYRRVNGHWAYERELIPNPGGTFAFGYSVAIGKRFIMVGAPGFGLADDGLVFVFDSMLPNWGQRGVLNGVEDGAFHARRFGISLAGESLDDLPISHPDHQEWFAIGSPEAYIEEDTHEDYVHIIHTHNSIFGAPRFRGYVVANPEGSSNCSGGFILCGDRFGLAVAVSYPQFAVGAPGFSSSRGRAYLFGDGGSVGILTKTLTADVPQPFGQFGAAVALSRDADGGSQMLIVGAPGQVLRPGTPQEVHAGAAYVFVRDHLAGCAPQADSWGLLARRTTATPPPPGGFFYEFGAAVAVSSAIEEFVDIDGVPVRLERSPTSFIVGEGYPYESEAVRVFSGMDPILPGPYRLALEVDPYGRIEELASAEAEENNLLVLGPVNQVNTITSGGLDPNGSYRFFLDGWATSYLSGFATAADVQSKLDRLPNVEPGDVLVEATEGQSLEDPGAVVTLRWMGRWAGRAVPLSLDYLSQFGSQSAWDLATPVPGAPEPVLNVCHQTLLPDLRVVQAEFDPVQDGRGFVIFANDYDNTWSQRTSAGVNVTVEMGGGYDGQLAGAHLEVWFSIEGGAPIQGMIAIPPLPDCPNPPDCPEGQYQTAFPLPAMALGDTFTQALVVKFPGPMLTAPGSYGMDVEVRIVPPGGLVDADPGNDTFTISDQEYRTLDLRADLPTFVQTYDKRMGNEDFNVSLGLLASLGLLPRFDTIWPDGSGHITKPFPGSDLYDESQASRGAIGALRAGLDLTLMGHDLGPLVQFRALVERDPVFSLLLPAGSPPLPDGWEGYGFVGLDLKYRNSLLGPPEVIYSFGPYDSYSLADCAFSPQGCFPCQEGSDCPDVAVDTDTGDLVWHPESGQISFEKEKRREKTFYPYGYPVNVEGVAHGIIGVETTLRMGNSLRMDIVPFVSFDTTVDIAFGDCDSCLGLCCVGLVGQLDPLVSDRFIVSAGLGLDVARQPQTGDPTYVSIGGEACFSVDNEIRLLTGNIKGYVVLGAKKFGIGTTTRAGFDIIDWEGFRWVQNFYRQSVTGGCVGVLYPRGGLPLDCSYSGGSVCDVPDPRHPNRR